MAKKKKLTKADRRITLTTFMLMFPGAIVTALAVAHGTMGSAAVAIALFFYQSVILKNYVESKQ